MKITEILKIEQNNTESIYLFKEGIFWRCYEISAWYFIKNIKEYRVFRKFVKIVNQDIVYLGFPDNTIGEILHAAETNNYYVVKNETRITISGIHYEKGFIVWKETIELTKPKIKVQQAFLPDEKIKSNQGKIDYNKIIQKIKRYDLMHKTPIEAFNFLAVIQKQLSDLKTL